MSKIDFITKPVLKGEKVLENQKILMTPIVRNKNKATIGYQPKTWGGWAE